MLLRAQRLKRGVLQVTKNGGYKLSIESKRTFSRCKLACGRPGMEQFPLVGLQVTWPKRLHRRARFMISHFACEGVGHDKGGSDNAG